MTEEQVNHVVEIVCERLPAAIPWQGTEPGVPTPNVKDLGCDPAPHKMHC
jgi:hypothetical protein